MSYVAFKTNKTSFVGTVVINIDDIASLFSADTEDGKSGSVTAIVLVNSIGYQVDMTLEQTVEQIVKAKHQTIDAALKALAAK